MIKMTEVQIFYDDILSTENEDNLNVFKDFINNASFSIEDTKKLLDVLEKRRVELKNHILETKIQNNFSEFIKQFSDNR